MRGCPRKLFSAKYCTMTKQFVQQIYSELLILGLCKSRGDFSTRWLGMNESYYRSIVVRDENISVRAQAHLTVELRDCGYNLANAGYDFMIPKGHILIDLHGRLLEEMFYRVKRDAMGFPAK